MTYRPYQERRRREQQQFEDAKKTLFKDLDKRDMSSLDVVSIVNLVLNQHQHRTGATRNRLFGMLKGAAGKHPKVVEYNEKLEGERLSKERDDADYIDGKEQLARKGAWAHQMQLPRDTWDPKSDR